MSKINGPIPPKKMRQLAEVIDAMLPEGTGFMLICFDLQNAQKGQYAGYVSNGRREDCIKAMRECALNLERQLN